MKFIQSDAHKRKRLKQLWRKPRGMHSKMRRSIKGHRASPSSGYHSPLESRGKIDGLTPVVVSSIAQVNAIIPSQIAVFSSVIGARLKVEMVKQAVAKNIRMNLKDPQKYLDLQSKLLEDRKKRRQSLKKVVKAEKKPEKLEETISEEDKKKAEKAEKDKVLTSKDAI